MPSPSSCLRCRGTESANHCAFEGVSRIEMASSTCCKSGVWNPIAGLRTHRGQLYSMKSRVEFRGYGNSGAPAGLGSGQGLVWKGSKISSATARLFGKKSDRLWLKVLCRSSNLQLSHGSEMTDIRKELARLNNTGAERSQLSSRLSSESSSLEVASEEIISVYSVPPVVAALSAHLIFPGLANGITINPAYGDVGALLEAGVQLIYLGALIILLGVGSFLVVRQVLIKRELETAAKDLQERVRTGDASSLEYFELGAVMLRKKYYQLANKYLDQAIKKWDGSEQDLAQVYNALGFSYFSDGKIEKAIAQYEKAVQLQPGYVIAWNNLADAYENQKDFPKALRAYDQTLQLDPTNKVASSRRDMVKTKVDRFQGIP